MRWFVFVLFPLVACTSHPSSVLSKATSIELITLDPTPDQALQPKYSFHGFRILQKTPVDPSVGAKFDTLIQKGLGENTGYLGACFNPRYGIRAMVGEEPHDFLLSFACNQIKVFADGKDQTYLTSNTPEAEIDKIFAESGLSPTPSNVLPKAGGSVNFGPESSPSSQSAPSSTSAPTSKP